MIVDHTHEDFDKIIEVFEVQGDLNRLVQDRLDRQRNWLVWLSILQLLLVVAAIYEFVR